MKRILSLLLGAWLIFACAHQSKNELETADITPVDVSQSGPAAKSNLAQSPPADMYSNGKRMIKKAHFRFEVNNIKEANTNLERAVIRHGAYIESSSSTLVTSYLETKMTIRVPNDHFPDLLKDVDELASSFVFRNVTTEDVSKDFVDLESRLKTKRQVEERYTNILRNKAGTIEELLQAEQQIGQLHEEIEATISRMNYLKEQVSYSTLSLEFFQKVEQPVASVEHISFGSKAAAAFSSSWETIKAIVLAMIYLWPLIAVALVTFWWFRKRKRTFVKAQS